MVEPEDRSESTEGLGSSVVACVILGVVAAGVAFYALAELFKGKHWSALTAAGFSLIVFGGCFSPKNFLWMLLPWTAQPLHPKSSTYPITLALGGIGFIAVIVGWIAG